jgi:hypothetical protein
MVGWLVDTFTADATLGAAPTPVAIFCGPVLSGTFPPLALYVATDDPYALAVGGTITGATSNQQWVGQGGAQKRSEPLSIYCTAEAWSGDPGTRGALVAVYGIVAAVEDILRTTARTTVGGPTANILEVTGSTGHTLQWVPGPNGLAAHVKFRIDVTARIGAP